MKLSIAFLAAAAGLGLGASAWAAEPVASAGGAGSAPVSTAAQIDAFLKATPVPDLPSEGPAGVTSAGRDARRVHGFVELGAGSDGYRHATVGAEVPLGQTGTLSIAVDQTKFNGRYGGWRGGQSWRGQTFAGSLAFGPGAQQDPTASPCASGRADVMAAERWSAFGAGGGCRTTYGGTVDSPSGPAPH